jgi:hypothetical protein
MRALDAVCLSQAIDQAVVGHDVRLELLLLHPRKSLVAFRHRAHPDPAVPGDEDRVCLGVGRTARTGALHLIEQEPGVRTRMSHLEGEMDSKLKIEMILVRMNQRRR